MKQINHYMIKKRIAAINSGIIPEGYKKTKVGIIPVEWEVVRLSNIGKNYIGLTYSPEDIVNNGLIVLRSSNIRDSKIDLTDCVFVKRDVNDKNIVKTNDILICSRNGSSNLIGKSALITAEFSDLAFGAFMSVYRTQYYSYVFQIFQSFIIKKQILRNLGARINQITTSDLNLFRIPFPPLHEQQKIVEILSTQDKLIELQERKIEQLKTLKKGYLQKMFPKKGSNVPELRFKGFTGDWEQHKFGDDNDLITGYPFESNQFSETGINLIRGMNVKRGYIDLSNDICVKWNSTKGLESYLLKENDIIIQMDGALIGKSYGKIEKNHLPALLVQRVTRARTYSEIADPDFMYQTIQRDFLTYINMNKTETAVPHLSLNDIKNFRIMVPTLLEQKVIGVFFANLDRLITLHQRKLDEEKQKKKALMQLLLTGKVRVK